MDSMQIIVTISGVALIGLTLWFFFGKHQENRLNREGILSNAPLDYQK
jgi:LPXTG-motif cell wall-anchored protein